VAIDALFGEFSKLHDAQDAVKLTRTQKKEALCAINLIKEKRCGKIMTRKTKELDQENLVTVFLGPVSDRHWLYLYMEIVARHTKLLTPIFISLLAMESMSLIVLWNKRIIPWNKDCLWAYRGDLS
jgi:hypothetical protein